MKVAIVCDWLVSVGGAERVLRSICDLFPGAPIYTSQYNEKKIDWFKDREVHVGYLQTFPTCFRRVLGPLRQKYFTKLDLSGYDLIISVTGAEAKSIKKGNALHLCYCHVPTQYYWGLKDDYLKNPGFGILNPLARLGLKTLLPPLKKADYAAAQLPDEFITISTYAAEQIKSAYGRESTIIFPPVAVEKFSTREFSTSRETIKSTKSQPNKPNSSRYGFVTTSRQVNWKRLDLAVKACMDLKLPLTVIGEGPEHKKLVSLAKKSRNIKFVPLQNQASLKKYLEQAEGYIFPSLEPFGIAPVEALACGCPVVAYGNGGALDYVIDGENGVLFGKQSVNSLRQALKRFSTLKFDETKVRQSALPFSEKHFQEKLKTFITKKVKEHKNIKPEKVKKQGSTQPVPAPKPPKPVSVTPPAPIPLTPSPAPQPAPKAISVPKPKPSPAKSGLVIENPKPIITKPSPKPELRPVAKVKPPKKAKKHVLKKPPEGSLSIKID